MSIVLAGNRAGDGAADGVDVPGASSARVTVSAAAIGSTGTVTSGLSR
jgi:hypothetical protein